MELTDRQLDDLIWTWKQRAGHAITTKFSKYSKDLAVETYAALQELKKLRTGIPVMGVVS